MRLFFLRLGQVCSVILFNHSVCVTGDVSVIKTEYEKKLDAVLKPGEKIDYIVLNHTEPDHSGCLGLVVDRFPDAKIIATSPGLRNIGLIWNRTFTNTMVACCRNGISELDIGGYTLHFILAPMLHWPDTMITHIPELKTIVTCDFFGVHFSSPLVFNDLIEKNPDEKLVLQSQFRYYYQCIMSPFSAQVEQALKKIEPLAFDTICPSHGPVIRANIDWYVQELHSLARGVMTARSCDKPLVLIAFVTTYHYTEAIAHAISSALQEDGLDVELHDLQKEPSSAILSRLPHASGLLLGTPTYASEGVPPVMDVATRLNPIIHAGMVMGAFGSYGWSGEGVKNIHGRLTQLSPRVHVPLPPMSVLFKPSEDELGKCVEWAHKFAFAVKNNGKLPE